MEYGPYQVDLKSGRFDIAVNSRSAYMDDPDDQLTHYVSSSSANYARYKDPICDDLYLKQSRAVDPVERRRLCKQLQLRVIDEMTYMVPFLWWHRMIPVPSNVKGIKLMPNHFINQDLSTIWLSKD